MNIIGTAFRPLDQLSPHHNQGVLYVMTRGVIGDVAAYQGPNGWDMYAVARSGDKISKEKATELFGDLMTEQTIYRR